jgi:hypothetical protein
MVGFDIPFAFVAAGAMTWRYGKDRQDLPMLFAGAGVAVPGLAFLAAYPDWDWQYFVDPMTLPVAAPAIFAATVILCGYLGAWCGACCPKVVAAVAAGLALFTVATLPRTLHVGTRAEYLAGTAPTVGADFLLFAAPWFLWSGLVLAFCIFKLEMSRKALRSRDGLT